jgi:L-aspartate oxidase
VTQYIPVAPGAHYSCGGILADLDGRTTLGGLYAVGEAASTGVQGANRLASNSVTEAIIAGRRAGEAIATDVAAEAITAAMAGDGCGNETAIGGWLPQPYGWGAATGAAVEVPGVALRDASAATVRDAGSGDAGRMALAQAMSRYAGVIRDADGLARLLRLIAGAGGGGRAAVSGAVREEHALVLDHPGELEAVEAANLRTVSLLIAAGAARRAESRGCHRRRDAGATGAAPWHTLLRLAGGRLVVAEEFVAREELVVIREVA